MKIAQYCVDALEFDMESTFQIAHFNVARLRHLPHDPRVAGFIDNVSKINEVAERSPGYVWRWADETAAVGDGITYQAADKDIQIAISLSVWNSVEDLWHFVNKTAHGSFLRRRAEWFEPWPGPNYVVWPHNGAEPPTLAEGWLRLKQLADQGASSAAYDFKFALASAEGQIPK
jgi:hypothetical protein